MNYINCTFKLAYTCITFTKIININISPYHLKNKIKSNVKSIMNLNNFNIILAGTKLGENNIPLNCNLKNIKISSLINKIYNNNISFYIKIINNNQFNNCSTNCPICYNTLIPLETIRFGCNHIFCKDCIINYFSLNNRNCPLCRI